MIKLAQVILDDAMQVLSYDIAVAPGASYVISGNFIGNNVGSKYTVYDLTGSNSVLTQQETTIGTSSGMYHFVCNHTPVDGTRILRIIFSGGQLVDLYYSESGGVRRSITYAEVYDLGEHRQAILKDAYDIHREYELDTWPTLKFSLPKNSPQWSYIVAEHRVLYEGEWYVIKGQGVDKDDKGVTKQEVECPSTAADLNSKYVQVLGSYIDKELIGEVQTGAGMMDKILLGTGWSTGVVSIDQGKQRVMQAEWEPVPSLLLQVKEKFGGYIVYRTNLRKVDLLEEPGADNGIVIQYGKNQRGLRKKVDSKEFVTRLYCYGSEEDGVKLTVNDVNPTNQSYIENFSYFISLGYTLQQIQADIAAKGEASVFVKVGVFEDSDYVDAQALYDDAEKKLDDELCKPKVVYEITLMDLSKLSGWEQESFAIGDWITIYDADLGIDVKARIVKMTEYPGYPEKTTVEIANFQENIGDVMASTVKFTASAQKNTTISQAMKNVINTYSTTINGTRGKLKWAQDVIDAIETNAQGQETGLRTRMTPGGFGVSQDGGQTYKTAITGQGVLAETVVANSVHILDIGADGLIIEGGTNGVALNSSLGLAVTRTDKKVRSLLNATYGIAIQNGDGSGGNWVDRFWVDTEGILHAERLESKGLIIRDTNGMLLIDAQNSKIDLSTFATVIVGGKITYTDVGALSDDTFIPDASYITSITYNTVTTSYVNALAVTARRLTASSSSGITLLDGYGDTMGGVLKIYDNNGYLNLKGGVESGQTDNSGGTLILYKDSPFTTYPGSFDYQRIELGIVNNYGIIQCKDDSGIVRVNMYAGSGTGPYIGVRDAAGDLKSYITETAGYINGEKILTGDKIIAKFA